MTVEKGLKAVAVLLAAAICVMLGMTLYLALNNTLRADRLFAAGDYEGARVYYERARNQSGVERCDAYAREERYLNARRRLQLGDFENARRELSELGGYRDAENLIQACDYMAAGAMAQRGEYENARDAYLALGDYPGCAQRIEELNEPLYQLSLEKAQNFELAEACRLWRLLEDYADCPALLGRTEPVLDWLSDPEREEILTPANHFDSSYYDYAYVTELGYLAVPAHPDRDTHFFLYYPGGRDEQISVDYFHYYLMNPEPNTIALFLNKNGLSAMEEKNTAAVELMERVAAECGVFMDELVVAGSSLGAYPAMFSALYTWEDFGIRVPCVLSLDAGSDWREAALLLTREQCRQVAEIGSTFYLFESPWVGLDRSAIRRMVEEGIDVVMVGCTYDEHTRISFDAMGLGVIHWAVGDRSEPCPLDIYDFHKLYL